MTTETHPMDGTTERIEALCEEHGRTLVDLAFAAGVDRRTLYTWRDRDFKTTPVASMILIADYLETTVACLVGED